MSPAEFPPPAVIREDYMRPDQLNPILPLVFYNVDATQLNRTQIEAIADQNHALSLYHVVSSHRRASAYHWY